MLPYRVPLQFRLEEISHEGRLKPHLHHVIDLSVYKRNQQYRALGASKMTKDRPLLFYSPNNFTWANDSTWQFSKLSVTLQQWINSLVTIDIPSTADILQVEPSQHLLFKSPHVARKTLYIGKAFTDRMNAAGRMLRPPETAPPIDFSPCVTRMGEA